MANSTTTWKCETCTLENAVDSQACAACLVPKTTATNHISPIVIKRWKCSRCTFENDPQNNECVMCEMSRVPPPANYCAAPTAVSNEVPPPPPPPSVPNSATTTTTWKCSRCTMENESTHATCAACEYPNENMVQSKPPSSSATNVPKKVDDSRWICLNCLQQNAPLSQVCVRCRLFRCTDCGEVINASQYIRIGNERIHVECFRCTGCSKLIQSDYQQVTTTKERYHPACYDTLFTPQCRVCGKKQRAGEVFVEPFWNDIICKSHGDPTKILRCTGCERICSASKVGEMLRVNDSVSICSRCSEDAVLGDEELAPIRSNVERFFALLGLQISLSEIPVQVVAPQVLNPSAPKNQSLTDSHHTLGRCVTEYNDLLMGGRRISSTVHIQRIMIITALPRIVFEDVLCHEFMHAYLNLMAFPKVSSQIEEGLCQLLSYLWLTRDLQGTDHPVSDHTKILTKLRLQKLERGTDPVYAEGFRLCYSAFLKLGCLAPLLEYVREHEKLPDV